MSEVLCELACDLDVKLISCLCCRNGIPRGPSTVICLDFMVTLTVQLLVGHFYFYIGDHEPGEACCPSLAMHAQRNGEDKLLLKLTIVRDGQ